MRCLIFIIGKNRPLELKLLLEIFPSYFMATSVLYNNTSDIIGVRPPITCNEFKVFNIIKTTTESGQKVIIYIANVASVLSKLNTSTIRRTRAMFFLININYRCNFTKKSFISISRCGLYATI